MSRVENRIKVIKGQLSNMNDIDEAYRALCAHFGEGISKMRAFTKSQHVINRKGLQELAIRFDCIYSVDPIEDYFMIKFAERDQAPIENTIEEEEVETPDDLLQETPKEDIEEDTELF